LYRTHLNTLVKQTKILKVEDKKMSIPSQEEFDAVKQRVEKLENDLKALKESYRLHQKDQTVIFKRHLDRHEMP